MREINQTGLSLIKEFEGVILKVYKDPIGILTVGVGHVVHPRDGLKLGQVITTKLADQLLREDLKIAENAVESAVTIDLTNNQFAACVSLCFNIGSSAFSKSTLVKRINANNINVAANEFLKWNRAGGRVLAGLTRRRNTERALFLKEDLLIGGDLNGFQESKIVIDEPVEEVAPEPSEPQETVSLAPTVTTTTTSATIPNSVLVDKQNSLVPSPVVMQEDGQKEGFIAASMGSAKRLIATVAASGLIAGQALFDWAKGHIYLIFLIAALAVIYVLVQTYLDGKRLDYASDPHKYTVK